MYNNKYSDQLLPMITPEMLSHYPDQTCEILNKMGRLAQKSSTSVEGGGEGNLEDIVQTSTSYADGGVNIVTAYLSDGTTQDFQIRNGHQGSQGDPGAPGQDGQDATIAVGTTTTLPAGSSATVTDSGTPSAAVLNFGIPKGDTGAAGADGQDGFSPIATVTKSGDTATISITDENGTTTATVTDGADGAAATISAGTTTTLPAGSSATVTNSGTSSAAVFDFGIPKGDKGDTGSTGPAGPGVASGGTTGQVLTKNSGTDYDTEWTTPATYSDFTGATSSVAGAHGLVPAPTTSDPDKFLKGDGTWGTPPGTTYTAGTGIDITGSTIAVDTDTVSMKSEYTVKKAYTIDLSAQSTSNFYPVIFPRTNNMIDCEIHSQGGGSAEPYNQNIIHFNVISEGWSDNFVRKKLIVLQEGNYDNNEIAIGSIGLGQQDGYTCVWLRGGIKYYFTSNFVAELHTSDYTINNEKYTVGTNYYGGTNANVTIVRSPLDTSKDVALLEDVDARANLYRYTKSQYNSSSSSWYYPIANLPIDNSGNSASVIINGRFGGWTNANMAKIDLLLTNRSDYSGNNVTASGSIKGPYTGALAMCNVVVYKQTDKSAIVYLKCDSYFAFDITADYYQATKSWTGNYTTTPSGTLIWSTATTDALEKVDQNGRISKVREVYNYYTARPASANLTQTGNGGMFTFQATGSMTTGKPKNDSHIIHLEWDNANGWDSQIAVNNNGSSPWIAVRAQDGGTWKDWVYLLNDTAGSVKTANIDALAVTTAKIADGSITEAKINATGWAKKVNVASIDLTGQTADLLTLTKALGTAGTDYARWTSKTDGGSANISNKPTGSSNASFVCEAFCSRWASNADYKYHLICRITDDVNPYIATIHNNSSSISWSRLRPTVNDATLTITQNGTSVGTFTANASSNATIALTDTTYSDMTGATSSTAGAHGLVPAPSAGDDAKVLSGAGTWVNQPTVNDATLTLTQGGSTLGTFTANASSNVTIDVPGGGGGGAPTGAITMFAGSTAPTGYLICDGSAVSRTTYADLFTAIGTTYGTGDGSTTFNLPNLKGKVPVGRDSADTSFDVLGETGGEKTHKLTVAEMPSHTHRLSSQRGTPGNSSWDYCQPGTGWNASAWNPNPTEPIGGNGYHNNLQPYIVLNYIIKT